MLLLIALLVLLLASGPWYPYSRNWGYFPFGGLLLVLIVIALLTHGGTIAW